MSIKIAIVTISLLYLTGDPQGRCEGEMQVGDRSLVSDQQDPGSDEVGGGHQTRHAPPGHDEVQPHHTTNPTAQVSHLLKMALSQYKKVMIIVYIYRR